MESFNIDLKNFQSIGDANLSFEPGVNLIVGQSNSGKTAILRAVSAVINNPTRGKYFIKKGTKSSEVRIVFNGNDIDWKRTPADSSYEINGETFKKTGRNNLFDLIQENGFIRDDSGNIMNIEGEWDLPFPFDRTPSELFKLFENIFCISDSAVILKSFKEEEANAVKERLTSEDKLVRVTNKINALEELAKEVNIGKTQRKLDIFSQNCDRYKEMSADLTKILKSEKYTSINLDEVTPPIEESLDRYIEAVKDYSFITKVVKRQKFYKSLPASVIIGDTIDKYEQAAQDYEHIQHAVELNKIDLSKECEVTGDTLNKYTEMFEDYNDLLRLKEVSKFDVDKECTAGNSLDDYETLLRDYKFIVDCYNRCKDLKKQYKACEQREAEAQEKLNKYKVCPLCGHELGDDKC